jgi:hypothetical protein
VVHEIEIRGRNIAEGIPRGFVLDSSEVLEALQEDNAGREVIAEAHASYVRIKVADECFVRFETVGEVLGRAVTRGDIEANMPSFAGFIRTEPDGIRFVAR